MKAYERFLGATSVRKDASFFPEMEQKARAYLGAHPPDVPPPPASPALLGPPAATVNACRDSAACGPGEICAKGHCREITVSDVDPSRGPAPRNAATVIFMRASSWGAGYHFPIVDEGGAYVGEPEASERVVVSVSPGMHTYVLLAENTSAVRIYAMAGRSYLVEVAPSMGSTKAKCRRIPMKPAGPTWERRQRWMNETRLAVVPASRGRTLMRELGQDVRREALFKAYEELARGNNDAAREHTMLHTDGF